MSELEFAVTATSRPPCKRCGNPIESKSNLAVYCNACRNADPNRHANRGSWADRKSHGEIRKSEALPEMIVHVDTEGDGQGNTFCASYGREDGSSGTVHSSDPVEIILWWMENLSGTYKGHRQIVGAFHFNYDTAQLTKFMDPKAGTLRLIHQAKSPGGLICNRALVNHDAKKCSKKFHAYDRAMTIKILTSGGEEKVITYDPETNIAIATTPRRRFYAEHRPKNWDYTGYTALDVHDMGTAFIGGLERVIEDWQPELSQEQRNIIAWGKRARKDNGQFEGGIPEKIAAYSEAECVAGARCARLLINTIADATDIKIKANALFGSGSIAAAAFRKHGQATNNQIAKDPEIDLIAWLCYFGGLIETPVIGHIIGLVHEEDLNSAYPADMIILDCMRDGHGKWKRVKRPFNYPAEHGLTANTIGYVKVEWNVDTPSTPPFMVRDKSGSVFQPLTGQGIWVTIPEYIAAVKQFGRAIKAKEAVYWVQTCDCPPPLAWLAELYAKRLAIKAEMKQHEKGSDEWLRLNCHQLAIKLVLNSCYGKLAQRRPDIGHYTNLHYAAHITGATRAKVRERTWRREKNGSVVIYQHTDSVLTLGRKPPAKDVGEKLGDWGLEDKSTCDPIILQPGVMAGLKEGKSATRGFDKDAFKDAARWYVKNHDLTVHPTEWRILKIPTRRMISRKMAIHRRKPHLMGIFVDDTMPVVPSGFKRHLENAFQVPGQPSAWFVPPIREVRDPATIKDIERLHNANLIGEDQSRDEDDESETYGDQFSSEPVTYGGYNPDQFDWEIVHHERQE